MSQVRQGMTRNRKATSGLATRAIGGSGPALLIPATLVSATLISATLFSSTASAQEEPGNAGTANAVQSTPQPAQGCPPGSWFCSEQAPAPDAKPAPDVKPAPEAKPAPPAAPTLQPLPPPEAAEPTKEDAKAADDKPEPSPPVVVYQPPPPVMVVPPSGEAPTYEAKRRAARNDRPEWGLHLNVTGTMMGSGAAKGAGMGGVGLGLRYRPIPYFALQAGVSFLGGRDYYATQRGETAFTGSFYVFLNPKDAFQLFLLGGFGWSNARIGDDRNGNPGPGYNYSYFGGMAGAGAEWRLAKHFALYGDVRAFLRSRTDQYASFEPEFVDSYGRTSNTSAGGLFSAGMTFYF